MPPSEPLLREDLVRCDAQAIIDAVERLSDADEIDLVNGENKAIVLPKGRSLHSLKPLLDQMRKKPERIKGTAKLESLASFKDHVNRFRRSNTAIFATDEEMVAVYDYHDATSPEWCDHRAVYSFPTSSEWQAWQNADGRPMPQAAFADFLEGRILDVTAPGEKDAEHFGELNYTLATPSQLMTLSRGLAVRVEMIAAARPVLSTGETEVTYKEEHSDSQGAPLKIPGGFMLLIPAFEGGIRYRIPVRLRYRVQGGKVVWSIHLHRADVAIRDAVKDACEEVAQGTSCPLFHGSPEAAND